MLKLTIVDPILKSALKEDLGAKDLTSVAVIPKGLRIKADLEFKSRGVLCGIEVAERVFRLVDEDLRFLPCAKDGEWIEPGREIAYIEGDARSILAAERVALNFLGRLSGIATLTRQFVEKTRGTSARIFDTRKTTPTLRVFERYAVKTGGGTNHRFGLFDQVLIKDNHLRILRKRSIADIAMDAYKSVTRRTPIGLEVKNLAEFKEALRTKVNYILLDNMTPELIRQAVALRKSSASKAELEVSGGVTLETVRAFAETGVERISVGALTHSAACVDVSLDIVA